MAHHQWISLGASRIQGDQLARMSVFSDVLNTLPLLIRYQTAADRAFHKACSDLLKAQKQRANSQIGFESQKADKPPTVAAEVPA
jgi:hypothetical protein